MGGNGAGNGAGSINGKFNGRPPCLTPFSCDPVVLNVNAGPTHAAEPPASAGARQHPVGPSRWLGGYLNVLYATVRDGRSNAVLSHTF